jgi:hypothetical protein
LKGTRPRYILIAIFIGVGVISIIVVLAIALPGSPFTITPSSFEQQRSSEGANFTISSIDSGPYGLTYGEWSGKWWQWTLSIPTDVNPLNDKTGENCAKNQNDTQVWFLAGTYGGTAERTCTIPSGKAIFFQ